MLLFKYRCNLILEGLLSEHSLVAGVFTGLHFHENEAEGVLPGINAEWGLETGQGPVHDPGEAGTQMPVIRANKVSFRAIRCQAPGLGSRAGSLPRQSCSLETQRTQEEQGKESDTG